MYKITSRTSDYVYTVLDTSDNSEDYLTVDMISMLLTLGFLIEGASYSNEELVIDNVEIINPEPEPEEYWDDEFDSSDMDDEVSELFDDEQESDESLEDEEEFEVESDETDSKDSFYDDMDSDELEELFYGSGDTVNIENMYTFIPSEFRGIIAEYYKWYTTYVFKKLRNDLKLNVSIKKIQSLAALRGTSEWYFGGINDTGDFGASYCELGHPVRYEYYAVSNTGDTIIFGEKCAGDFFNISDQDMRSLIKIRKDMCAEILKIARQFYYDEVSKDYEDLALFYDIVDKVDDNSGTTCEFEDVYPLKVGYFLKKFIPRGIPVPKSLVKLAKVVSTSNGTSVYDLLVALYGEDAKIIDKARRSGGYSSTILNSYIKFMFTNRVDGIYAYNPIKKVCKEEGSFNRASRVKWNRDLYEYKNCLCCKEFTYKEFDDLMKLIIECGKARKELKELRNTINVERQSMERELIFKYMEKKDRMSAMIYEKISKSGGFLTSTPAETAINTLRKALPYIKDMLCNYFEDAKESKVSGSKTQSNSTQSNYENKNNGSENLTVNNKYNRLSNPEVFARVDSLTDLITKNALAENCIKKNLPIALDILGTVRKFGNVSDKQLIYIDKAIDLVKTMGYM